MAVALQYKRTQAPSATASCRISSMVVDGQERDKEHRPQVEQGCSLESDVSLGFEHVGAPRRDSEA